MITLVTRMEVAQGSSTRLDRHRFAPTKLTALLTKPSSSQVLCFTRPRASAPGYTLAGLGIYPQGGAALVNDTQRITKAALLHLGHLFPWA